MTHPDPPPAELLDRIRAILAPHRAQLQPMLQAAADAEDGQQ